MAKKINKNVKIEAIVENEAAVSVMDQTNKDLMVSILIVSLLVNVTVLIAWIALKVTAVYDAEVAAFLFTR